MVTDILMAEITRGNVIESTHIGSGVLVSATGEIQAVWGNANRQTFPRSAMKSLQTLTILTHGTKLTTEQTALASASHHGEIMHASAVRQWLIDMNLTSEDLSCGPDLPRYLEDRQRLRDQNISASRIYHNCSGKHCGQLAFCQHQGWNVKDYHLAKHPAQQAMLAMITELAEEEIDVVGIDGCAMPAPRLSLTGFGRALSKIAAPTLLKGSMRQAAEQITSATMQFPYLTGGTKSPNSKMTEASEKKFFAKNGAEGVYAVILPGAQAAMVLKIADGNMRAANVAIAGMLLQMADQLGLDKAVLNRFCSEDMFNSAGTKVGVCRFANIMPTKN
ncbi:MAG: asparaginase [Candidatus Pelagibacterales bacterium]|jgi:L-asparaginase II